MSLASQFGFNSTLMKATKSSEAKIANAGKINVK